MNVLYVSYDGMTDPLGQSQVIPYLAHLSKKGYSISIVSCEKKERFAAQSITIRQLLDSYNISWFPVPYSKLPSVFSKRMNLLALGRKADSVCKEKKPVIVHCRSYMAALIGLKLKRKYNTKFIFDMRGFWADERIDGGIWNLQNPVHKRIYNYFKKKEIEFLLNADHTISLTKSAKKEIGSWKALENKNIPITVIPCCADLDLFSKKHINSGQLAELKKSLGIHENDLVLSYLGSIGTWYMADEMLDFFKLLSEKKPTAKFLFITPDDPSQILSKARQKGIDPEKISIRSATRKEVPYYLSASDLAIYFIKPLYSKMASSPTKTAEIMGLGIPIITNSGIGDSDKILEDAQAGALIDHFTGEEYARIINQIDVLLKLDGNKITEASRNYFSLEKGVELYAGVYSSLTTKKI